MKLLNIEEVAEDLGVSRQTVARIIAEGSLPAICPRTGRRKRCGASGRKCSSAWLKERETSPRGHPAKKIAHG